LGYDPLLPKYFLTPLFNFNYFCGVPFFPPPPPPQKARL
jgi:hypothetical protein